MSKIILICTTVFLLFLIKSSVTENEVQKNVFSIDLFRQKSPLSKYKEHYELLKKYGYKKPKPPQPPRTNDSIALYRALDNEFYGKIIIGHPAQTFNVAFDTAWTLSWIMSSKCKASGCEGHSKYDHTRSSEYKKDGRPYSLDSLNLTGFFSYDNITFAHSNVTCQSFVEMTQVPDDFVTNKADGIIGLGLKYDSYDPFFYNLLKEKKIKDPIFSIYLNRDSSSKRGGSISLGFIDDKSIHKTVINGKVVRDNITYLPVTSNQFWQFKMDQVVLEPWRWDKEEHIFCDGGCQAIADTNSNEIFASKENVDVIHESIKADYDNKTNQFYVNCGDVKTLPHLTFVLAGKNFTILPDNYILKVATNQQTICISSFKVGNQGNNWVLGGAFLSQFYSIYNVHENVIGFVRSASAV